jgi:hypothetical protein
VKRDRYTQREKRHRRKKDNNDSVRTHKDRDGQTERNSKQKIDIANDRDRQRR